MYGSLLDHIYLSPEMKKKMVEVIAWQNYFHSVNLHRFMEITKMTTLSAQCYIAPKVSDITSGPYTAEGANEKLTEALKMCNYPFMTAHIETIKEETISFDDIRWNQEIRGVYIFPDGIFRAKYDSNLRRDWPGEGKDKIRCFVEYFPGKIPGKIKA